MLKLLGLAMGMWLGMAAGSFGQAPAESQNIWNRSYSAARQRFQQLGRTGVYDPYRHTTHFPGAGSLRSSPFDVFPPTVDEGSLRRVSYTYNDPLGRPVHVWGERWTSYGWPRENLQSRVITEK